MNDTNAPVDIAALQELRNIMGDEFDLLIEVFVNDSVQRLADIETAISEGDAPGLRTTAHGFKGSALNISAAKLTELCQRLEALGRDGQIDQARPLFTRVRDEFELVREYLQTL